MAWGEVNEYVLLRIYSLLSTGDLASAGKVCRRWRGISRWAHASVDITLDITSTLLFCILLCRDELLWKRIVVRSCYGEAAAWGEVSLCPGTLSWFREAEDARRGAGNSRDTYYLTLHLNICTHLTARVAQIKKVIVLMTYFVLSDH